MHDLNADPSLPFDDDSFDHATCCVSVDYLTRPVDVFRDVARVVRPGGLFVCTFSNRLFPTKAIRGWLHSPSATHVDIVAGYFAASGAFEPPLSRQCATPPGGDPLYAVWSGRVMRLFRARRHPGYHRWYRPAVSALNAFRWRS